METTRTFDVRLSRPTMPVDDMVKTHKKRMQVELKEVREQIKRLKAKAEFLRLSIRDCQKS